MKAELVTIRHLLQAHDRFAGEPDRDFGTPV